MHFNQLFYFYETIKSQSICAAAQNLHISQPALSKAIKSLETDLGQKLLVRTNRGVYPTPIGEKIYTDIIVLQEMISGWYANSDSNTSAEQIYIGCIACANSHLLNQVILPFRNHYPKIEVVMQELFVHSTLRMLKNMPYHLAITSIPPFRQEQYQTQAQDLDWTICPLFTDERRILIGANHSLAQKDVLTAKNLQTLSIAYYSNNRDVISSVYEPYFASSYKMPTKESIMELVLNNQAVFTPVYHMIKNTDYYIKHRMVKDYPIPITDISSKVPIIAVITGKLSKAEQLFLDYLLENFALTLN